MPKNLAYGDGFMLSLAHSARAYLEAGGFKLRRSAPGFLDMERPAASGALGERMLLWADDRTIVDPLGSAYVERAQRDTQEAHLLKSFEREMATAPDATGYYLVDSRLGFSQRFIATAKDLLGEKGGIRAPVEFFDAAYKIDNADGRRVRSGIGDLLAKADKTRRVPQPFLIRRGLGSDATPGGGDLVDYLERSISSPGQKPKLRIIEGNAGSGKTVAFNALVMSLYRAFIEAKRARQERRRPIVFLPAHLRSSQVGYVDDVIAAVAETDAAGAVASGQFKWLLLNGYALWMFDGLDEFYAGNSDFFSFLEEALTAPNSKAQFVICTRGSLMSSSKSLRSFVERHAANGYEVEICQLAPWTACSWRELARLELEDGQTRKADPAVIADFVSALETAKGLGSLAQLPFYCSILLEHFLKAGALQEDELESLEFLVNRMIDREQGKNVFRWQDFVNLDRLSEVVDNEVAKRHLPRTADFNPRDVIRRLLEAEGRDILFELIGSIAHKHRRMGAGTDASGSLSVEDVRELSSLVNVPFSLNAEVVHRLRTVIVQFAFFGPGREAGSVDFTHPILADYLAARYAVTLLRRELCDTHEIEPSGRSAERDLDAVSRAMRKAVGAAEFVPHSLFGRYLVREIRRDAELGSRLFPTRDLGEQDHLKSPSLLHSLN